MSVDYGNLSSHVRTGGAGGGGEDFIDNLQPKGQCWLVSSCERLVRVSVSVSIARILLEIVESINKAILIMLMVREVMIISQSGDIKI